MREAEEEGRCKEVRGEGKGGKWIGMERQKRKYVYTWFATSAHSSSLPREGKSERKMTPPTVKPDHTGTTTTVRQRGE